jgi:Domain of unknown function (DUF4382)
MTLGHLGHVVAAVIINALFVTGAGVGMHYVAPGLTNGTTSIGFQGTPERGVSHIYLRVSNMMCQGGKNTTNSMYFPHPVSFDALSLVNVTRMLGDVSMTPGQYDMITFVVSSAVATIGGQNVTLKVPSEEVQVPVQFEVVHGQPTSVILTLSFDDNLIIQNHILSPVITNQVDGPG